MPAVPNGSSPSDRSDPTDVAWRRLVAAVVDVGIGAAISIPLYLLLSEDVYRFETATRELTVSRELTGWGAFLFGLWWLAYAVGVFVLQRGWTGRTVGTLLTGVAVVDVAGRPLGPGGALVRSVGGVVDYLPCCLPVVGVVTIFTTQGHRRVGDMAARSYAIDARRMHQPVLLPATGPPAGPPGSAAPLPPPPAGLAPGTSDPAARPTAAPAGPTPPDRPSAALAGPPTRQVPPTAPPAWDPAGPDTAAAPPDRAVPTPTPVWNPERGAYMAWDARRQQWLQFDQGSQRWLQYDVVTKSWRPVG